MNATIRLSVFSALVVFVSPDTLLAAPPHTGQVIHDGFELSDVALFVLAVAGVWFARRSMRRRAVVKRHSFAPPASSEGSVDRGQGIETR